MSTKENWIAFIVSMAILVGIGVFFLSLANQCADKGGRFLIGGKYDYPACVQEVK